MLCYVSSSNTISSLQSGPQGIFWGAQPPLRFLAPLRKIQKWSRQKVETTQAYQNCHRVKKVNPFKQ